MHNRFRNRFALIGAVALAVLVVGTAALILLSMTLGNFDLLPQDCPGTRIHFSGTVKGTSSAVITVKGDQKLHGGSSAIDLQFLTDANGSFDSGTTYLPVFACESLQISVSAPGFVAQSLDYMPLYHFSDAELSTSISSGQPLAAQVEVALQPAK